ncbi:hypothetical protein SAMN04487997_1484 [Frateuria terrea]|uniref:Uncharacterized protein n=1 Tax=Frateuria terrea TaxID=529704 RepID=A0A1H6SNH3_9GAMM|nr:hypothetical protein SAMN04487997_1484 [Frateuria terrea]SFP27576.1 hypothetical protein SAMN02927913_1399 [Frateuria terrea]
MTLAPNAGKPGLARLARSKEKTTGLSTGGFMAEVSPNYQ